MSEPNQPVELRSSVQRGLVWTLGSQLALQAWRFVVVLVLARLLTPRELGLAAMALAVSAIVPAVLDLGFSAALVQRSTIAEQDRSTAFWTSAGVGLLLTVAGIGLAKPVADFFGEPRVAALFAALSVGFFLSALASTHLALLTRAMNFRAIELTANAAALASGAAAVAIAAFGGGPWAIVGQSLTASALTVLLLWAVSSWRPSFVFSRESLGALTSFGGSLTATRVLVYLQRNVDNLLVGRVLGAAPLGAYGLAYNLVLLPFVRIVDPVRRVLFPALSRVQSDRARLADLWLRGTRALTAVVLPALLGLAVVAPEFIHVVLGDRWSSAAPVARVLAIAGAFQIVVALNAVVLTSLGLVSTLLRYFTFATALTVAGFVAGVTFGIRGVAVGYAVASLLAAPPYVLLTARALAVPASSLARALAGVAQATALMLLAVFAARALMDAMTTSAPLRLVVEVAVGIGVYVPLCLWRVPEVRFELRRVLADRRGLAVTS